MKALNTNSSPIVKVQLTAEDRKRLVAVVEGSDTTLSAYVRKLILEHLKSISENPLTT